MSTAIKKVAIIGANKDGMSLLPLLLKDHSTRVAMILDPNPNAMLFKLGELGYRLNPSHHIHTSTNIEDIKKIAAIDIIINAAHDPLVEKFLDDPYLKGVERLSPLSAKLRWGVRVAAAEGGKKEGMERHTALLSSLKEIVDAVRLTRDRNELLSDILNLAIESTRAETGSIMLVSRQEAILKMEIARGMDEEVVRKIKVPLGEGIAGKVAREGKPVIISGRAKTEEFFHLKDRRPVQNALCVPLSVEGVIIGVINVNSANPEHSFTDDDLNFLTSLSGLAGEVIERASEYERLRTDAAKYSLWKELEVNMNSDKPLHKKLNMVCKKLAEFVHGLVCYIYLYDGERKKLVLKSSSLSNPTVGGAVTLDMGEGVEGWVGANAKPVVLVDRFAEGNIKRVYASVPMMAKGRIVGVFKGEIVSTQGMTQFAEAFLKDMATLIAESIYEHRNIEEEIYRTKKLFSVDELGLEFFSLKDSKRLLPVIVTAAAEVLGCEGALMRLDESGGGQYREVSSFGLDGKKARENFLPIEDETVREVIRKKELVIREFSEEASPYVRGVLACPLMHDSTPVGVLSFFNKLEKDSRYAIGFSLNDAEVLQRLVVYIEKVIPSVIERLAGKEELSVATPKFFERRVEEEINRSRRLGKTFVISAIRIAGLKGVERHAKKEFIKKLLIFIREKIRSFDAITLLDDETIGILFAEADELAMNVLEKVISTEGPMEFRKGIHYGCACYPGDGQMFTDLFSKAYSRSRTELHKESGVVKG